MTSSAARPVALGTAFATAALLLVAPTPAAALQELRSAGSATDTTGPLVALLSLLAWALAGWLLLCVLLTAGAHLPGLAGRALALLSRRVAPAAVRRTIELTLGLTVAVGALGTTPAAAGPAPQPAANLDWAAPPAASPAAPVLDWAAAPTAPATSDSTDEVVVQPGDSLWNLAEQDLAEQTGAAPTDAQVAQAWPAWWAANRDAVGDDPDLLQPGTRLSPPPADGSTPPAGPASS